VTEGNVVPLRPDQPAAADPPAPPVGRIELVTVVGYGGLPLQRMVTISDAAGGILFCSAQPIRSDDEAVATFQQLCEILGACYDETEGNYRLQRARVDEHGRPVPGAPS
jgi:hypothetical protein